MGAINWALSKLDPFEPKGLFSFEFANRLFPWIPVAELFFLLPPESYSIKENYKVNVTKTISDFYVDDFGIDTQDISLSGSLWSYWFGSLPDKLDMSSPRSILRSLSPSGIVGGAQSLLHKLAGSNQLSGIQEFFKLKFILARFRDDKTHWQDTPFEIPGITQLFVLARLGLNLYKDIKVVYHDYDDHNHYEVIINSFTFSRDAKDPFTLNYSIQMTGVKVAHPLGELPPGGFLQTKERPTEFLDEIKGKFLDLYNQLLSIPMNFTIAAKEDKQEIMGELPTLVDQLSVQYNEFVKDELFARTTNKEPSRPEIAILLLADKIKNLLKNIMDELVISENIDQTDYEAGLETIISDDTIEVVQILNTLDQVINEVKTMFKLSAPKIIYQFHKVNDFDTLTSLSVKYFGSPGNEQLISEENDITDSQIASGDFNGKVLKIPKEVTTQKTDNFIYFTFDFNSQNYDYFINNNLGIDIAIPLIDNGAGDLGIVKGYKNYIEQLNGRFSWEQGSLNPINLDWGFPTLIGEIPEKAYLSKLQNAIVQQVMADPRSEELKIIDVTIEAGIIRVKTQLKDIATQQFQEEFLGG